MNDYDNKDIYGNINGLPTNPDSLTDKTDTIYTSRPMDDGSTGFNPDDSWLEYEQRKITDQEPLRRSGPVPPPSSIPSSFVPNEDIKQAVPSIGVNTYTPEGEYPNKNEAEPKPDDPNRFGDPETAIALERQRWTEVVPPASKMAVTVDGSIEVITEPGKIVNHDEVKAVDVVTNPFEDTNNKDDLIWLRNILTSQDQDEIKRLLAEHGMTNIAEAMLYAKDHNLIEGYTKDEPNKEESQGPTLG